MSLKEQIQKLKENWLLVGLVLIVLLLSQFGGMGVLTEGFAPAYESLGIADRSAKYGGDSGIIPSPGESFAPDVTERKISKTSSMTAEVEQGNFWNAQERLQSLVTSTDSYLLSQNVNKYDSGRKSYYSGNYQLKVDVVKYDAVVSQLKELGEVTYFNENSEDVTGSYQDTTIELEAEKARLARYKEMLMQATSISDKLELNDRIFNQERTIKYLEDSLKNIGQRVEYATIYVTIQEKRSAYADVIFVTFSQLVQQFVQSINSVLNLLVGLIPYAVVVLLLWFGIRWIRKRK